jgi:hypothetical protein
MSSMHDQLLNFPPLIFLVHKELTLKIDGIPKVKGHPSPLGSPQTRLEGAAKIGTLRPSPRTSGLKLVLKRSSKCRENPRRGLSG